MSLRLNSFTLIAKSLTESFVKAQMVRVGEYVFAKMRGFPPWPAVVEEVLLSGRKSKVLVYFYGTHQIGTVKELDIFPFKKNFDKFKSGSKRKSFLLGLEEIGRAQAGNYKYPFLPKKSVPRLRECSVLLRRIPLLDSVGKVIQRESSLSAECDKNVCPSPPHIPRITNGHEVTVPAKSVLNNSDVSDVCHEIKCNDVERSKKILCSITLSSDNDESDSDCQITDDSEFMFPLRIDATDSDSSLC